MKTPPASGMPKILGLTLATLLVWCGTAPAAVISDDFNSYPAGSISGSLGSPGYGTVTSGQWLSGWHNGASNSAVTASIANTSPINSGGNRLAGTISANPSTFLNSGGLDRAYDVTASGLSTRLFTIGFDYRADAVAPDMRVDIFDNNVRSFGGPTIATSGSVSWQLIARDGFWFVYDGSTATEISTGVPFAAGTSYSFVITVNPVSFKWEVGINNGTSIATFSNLGFRNANFTTDTATAIGGRWLNFTATETADAYPHITTFSLDNVSIATSGFIWTPTSLYNGTHPPYTPGAWTTDWVPGPDGTGQSIKVTIASGATYYNFVVIPRSYLNSSITQFRAVLSFRVATPAVMPKYFYMFARCSGVTGQPEYWQRFVAEPASGPRTIEFPLDLPAIPGGTWNLYLGCLGTGSLIIDGLVVKDGWGLTTEQPVVNATPVSILPPHVTAATGAPAITIDPPAAGTVTTWTASTLVADGATPVSSATAAANSAALQTLLNTAKNTAGTKKILIPPGTYRFESAAQIDIQDTNDLTLDGQGSDFIFQRLYTGPHFSVSNCNRTIIKNLNLDWNWDYKPIASLGKVLSLSADQKTAVFEFAGLTTAQTLLTKQAFWHSLSQMDPVKLYRDGPEFFLLKDTPPVSLVASGNQITATFVNPLSLQVNRSYLIKHLYYEMIAFKIAGSAHLTFDTVNIYSVPGIGWLNTEASHHLKWVNCNILRRTGSSHPLVSGADGIHSAESQGDIVIQNCSFTGLGDDAINLHDNCWQGGLDYTANTNQLILRNCPRNKLRLQSGDVIRFFNPDYSPADLELTVSGTPVYTAPPGGTADSATADATVTFTTAVPAGLSRLLIANNTRFETKNVLITGTQFLWTNGRGILLSARDATIENGYFRNVTATSLQITTEIVDTAFMEGRGASNIVVRNNTFENTGQSARFGGSVIHVGAIIPWGPADYFLFDTLLFDGNRFFNAPGPAMSFVSNINVIVRNSRIEHTQAMPNQTPYSGALQAEVSADMALGGNTWTNYFAAPYVTGAVFNPALVTNLEYQINRMENH
jgi:hypothetical protein